MSSIDKFLAENPQMEDAESAFADWDGDEDVNVYEGPNFHDVYLGNFLGDKHVCLDTWSLPDHVLVVSKFHKEDDAKLTSLIQRLVAARDWLNQ